MVFPGDSAVKYLPTRQETQEMRVRSSGGEDPLEEGMATRSSTLLENPMDWEPGVNRVAESERLKRLNMHMVSRRLVFPQLSHSPTVVHLCFG